MNHVSGLLRNFTYTHVAVGRDFRKVWKLLKYLKSRKKVTKPCHNGISKLHLFLGNHSCSEHATNDSTSPFRPAHPETRLFDVYTSNSLQHCGTSRFQVAEVPEKPCNNYFSRFINETATPGNESHFLSGLNAASAGAGQRSRFEVVEKHSSRKFK